MPGLTPVDGLVVFDRKARSLIRLAHLPGFLAWSVSRQHGWGRRMRRLGSALAAVRLGPDRATADQWHLFQNHPEAAWMLCQPDGSRVLLFDPTRRTITRVALEPAAARLDQEAAFQCRMGTYAPGFLSVDPAQGVSVEPWLDLRPVAPDRRLLEEALAVLKTRLYRPRSVSVESHLGILAPLQEAATVLGRLKASGLETLMISEIHGDLWSGNIARDAQDRLVILDWEYARVCAVSYDLWTFLRQEVHHGGLPTFPEAARSLLDLVFTPAQAAACQVLHLAERLAHLERLALSHKAAEVRDLRAELHCLLGAQP